MKHKIHDPSSFPFIFMLYLWCCFTAVWRQKANGTLRSHRTSLCNQWNGKIAVKDNDMISHHIIRSMFLSGRFSCSGMITSCAYPVSKFCDILALIANKLPRDTHQARVDNLFWCIYFSSMITSKFCCAVHQNSAVCIWLEWRKFEVRDT